MAASLPAIDFIIEGVEVDFARLAVSAGRPKDEWKALFVVALALGWEKLTGKLPGRTTAGAILSIFYPLHGQACPVANHLK